MNDARMEGEVLPQIPGAASTVVEWIGQFVALRNGAKTVQVNNDGSILLYRDTRLEIPGLMTKGEEDTAELQRWFKWAHVRGGPWVDTINRWVTKERAPDPSVKNWFPTRLVQWAIGKHGQKNTYNEDQDTWVGGMYEFTHFVDEGGRDGLIIMWNEGDDARTGYMEPEIWYGDVDAFFATQRDGDPEADGETLERWNDLFENGIVWAFLQMGFFEFGRRSSLPKTVKALLRRRPELLDQARGR